MKLAAKEVLRRKHSETDRRGGIPPSKEELQRMCSQVLTEQRRGASCGNGCAMRSKSDVNASDDNDSYYAPVDYPTLGLEQRIEKIAKSN